MFDLASYLPYLVNRTGVGLADRFSEDLRAYGVTLQMWRVMAALHHRDGQRVGELADMTSIEVSTLSRLLGAMEVKGILTRRRSREDARTVAIRLTETGARLTTRIVPRALHYEAVALRHFTAEEAAALKAMLCRVFGNLALLDDEAPARARRTA